MTVKSTMVLLIVATILFFGCATSQSTDDQTVAEEPVAAESDIEITESPVEEKVITSDETEELAPHSEEENNAVLEEEAEVEAQTEEDKSESGSAELQPQDEHETESNAEIVPEPEPPEPPTFLTVVFTPEDPHVGDAVTVSVEATNYDTIEYDFGSGFASESHFSFLTFGVKRIAVRIANDELQSLTEISVPVYGTASISLDRDEIQHNIMGTAAVVATVAGEGEYEEIRGYFEGGLVYKSAKKDRYDLPIDFVETRNFTFSLFMEGKQVADGKEISITGLNAPPDKPQYEGNTFLRIKTGEEISFTVTSEDINDDELLYEVKPLPDGAEFNQSTGGFSWTPEESQTGMYLLTFHAYDLPFMTKKSFAQRGLHVVK